MRLKHKRLNAIGELDDKGRLLMKRYGSEVNHHLDGLERFRLSDFRPTTEEPNELGQLMIGLLVTHALQLLELEQLDYWFHEGNIPPSPPWEYYEPPKQPKVGGNMNRLRKLQNVKHT